MHRSSKGILTFVILGWIILFCYVQAAASATLDSVLQKGLPSEVNELSQTTDRLMHEYQTTHNIVALIFYAYGLLRQADHFQSVNDYVNAAQYAKSGFFFLDEAVDLHQDDPRVHYLRARIDAYLPAKLGRCVITLHDTDLLLAAASQLSHELITQVNYMRYRALCSCQQSQQAERFLAQIDQTDTELSQLLRLAPDTVPDWGMVEMRQIIIPLMTR